ncbi:MAG TPA: NAD(P)-dependent oxidoreductase [Burkholderiales bacterium]|nr:NAD(P)-dependent oxidoreductase [Burkholderiales bacterium]
MADPVIGFIGLGVMGEPMCRNVRLRGGYRVVAYDLDPAPLQRLAPHGIEPAEGAGPLVRGCEIVLASLPSGRALAQLAYAQGGLLQSVRAGQILVDLGTSPVALTRELAAEFLARGVRYLDAPVARTRQAAEEGTLSVMVGGDAATLEEVKPVLACFASQITHCGALGSGQVTKILNNMVLFQTVAALSEAYAIARRSGVDPKLLFDALSKGSADSFALRNHGAKAIVPQVFPLRAFSVEYAKKDLGYALELAAQGGVDAEGARRIDRLFDRAISQGLGDQYFPVVSRILDGSA